MTLLDGSVDFDGSDYVPEFDRERLTGQLRRIYRIVLPDVSVPGPWFLIADLARRVGAPEASTLAQIGHLRKERFGSHLVEKQSVGDRRQGLWRYRAHPPGTAVPRRSPLVLRIEELEAALGQEIDLSNTLAEALALVDPSNQVLAAYRGLSR